MVSVIIVGTVCVCVWVCVCVCAYVRMIERECRVHDFQHTNELSASNCATLCEIAQYRCVRTSPQMLFTSDYMCLLVEAALYTVYILYSLIESACMQSVKKTLLFVCVCACVRACVWRAKFVMWQEFSLILAKVALGPSSLDGTHFTPLALCNDLAIFLKYEVWSRNHKHNLPA